MDFTLKTWKKMGCKEIIVCSVIFVLLSALPITQNHHLWTIIPLYFGILFMLWMGMQFKTMVRAVLLATAGGGTIGLAAIYIYHLLPRSSMIQLGVAAAEDGTIYRIVFILSGLYALFSIVYIYMKFRRSMVHSK